MSLTLAAYQVACTFAVRCSVLATEHVVLVSCWTVPVTTEIDELVPWVGTISLYLCPVSSGLEMGRYAVYQHFLGRLDTVSCYTFFLRNTIWPTSMSQGQHGLQCMPDYLNSSAVALQVCRGIMIFNPESPRTVCWLGYARTHWEDPSAPQTLSLTEFEGGNPRIGEGTQRIQRKGKQVRQLSGLA